MKQIHDLIKRGENLIVENSPAILTAVGVVGTVTTAVLTGRASFQASEVLQQENARIKNETEGREDSGDLPTTDKVKLVWPLFVPPAASGVATIAAIIGANRISSTKAAALAAAYGLSEKRLQEYKDKVTEKFGDKKATDVRDEIAQDDVKRNPPDGNIVIVSGEVLCKDSQTGRYFTASVDKINRRLNELNDELINHDYASAAWFFEPWLEATNVTNELGWNRSNDGLVDLALSTVLVDEERPCVVVDFTQQPHLNYNVRSYA